MLAGLAPGTPQFEGRHQGRTGEERLLRQDPRGTHLRVHYEVVVGPERAVVVAPNRPGQEDAVLPGQLFLEIHPHRLVLEIEVGILEPLPDPASAHGVDASDRERLALTRDLGKVLPVVLHSRRGLGGEIGPEGLGGGGRVVERHEGRSVIGDELGALRKTEPGIAAAGVVVRRLVVGEVAPEGESVVQPPVRPVSEGEPDPAPIDVVEPLDFLERLGRHPGQVAASGVVGAEPAAVLAGAVGAGPDHVGGDGLGGGSGPGLRPGVAEVEVHLELLAGGVAEVAGGVELVLPVVADDPFVPIVAAAEEVPDRVGAALDRQGTTEGNAGLERRSEAKPFVILDQVEPLDGALTVAVVHTLVEPGRVPEPVGAGAELRAPRGPARSAPLGDDLDDAVGGFGAIQGRRRRALEDLDRLDVVRVDIVDTGRPIAASAESDAVGAGRVVRADAIDKDDRLGAEAERTHAPDSGHPARPHLAAGPLDLNARYRHRERLLHALAGRHLLGGREVEHPNHVAEGPALGFARGTGHHQFIELERCFGQRDGEVGGADRGRPAKGLVADPGHDQRGGGPGEAADRELAADIGPGREGGPLGSNLNLRERAAGPGVADDPADGSGLRLRARREERGERRGDEPETDAAPAGRVKDWCGE